MSDQSQPTRPVLTRLLLVLVPLAAMLGAFVWIASLDPLRSFNNGAPAVEALTVERTILDEAGIGLLVRAGGSERHGYCASGRRRCVLDVHARPAGTDCARRYRLGADPLSLGFG